MLGRLNFKNFKGWPEANLKFGKITGLFGTNSSGKTSLIQFLLLLKQTKDAADRGLTLELGGPHVKLGSYRDFIYQHDETKNLEWELGWTADHLLKLFDPNARPRYVGIGRHVKIKSTISSDNGSPKADFLEYELRQRSFRLTPQGQEKQGFKLQVSGDFKLKRPTGRAWHLPGPVKSYAFPDQVRTYFLNTGFLGTLVAAFEHQMDLIYYLGPLRDHPRREYPWTRSRPSDVGPRGETVIEAILSATEKGEKRSLGPGRRYQPFQTIIAHWLREMGLVSEFSVREVAPDTGIYRARVRAKKGSPEVLLTDVGFGVSQVLPVLTLLYYCPEGSTVILEQPEIHLHPMAQTVLADVILSASSTRRIQVIVESHSEHLLLRLQTRIAEEAASIDDLKLYFCLPSEKGEQQLIPLQLDLLGNIQNWPAKFFGDAFGETAQAQLARLKRKKSMR